MVNKYVRHFVCIILAMLGMTQSAAAFTDFAVQLTNADVFDTNNTKFGVKVAADGTYAATAFDDATANFTVNSVRFNDAQHGWVNCEFKVPVEGPVKIELGDCQYGGQHGTITDAAGNQTEIKANATKACWNANAPHDKVVVAYYAGTAPTTLTIYYEGYCPFIGVSAINLSDIPSEATLTFALGDSGAEGNVPAPKKVEVGSTVKIPANTTLYVEGKTLTAWTDGSKQYKAGEEITVSEDITLTPIFSANAVAFNERPAETTLVWQFGEANGAGTLNAQGKTTFLITQAAIGNDLIDVKMDIDATNGKINNVGRGDEWAQCNDGTKLTIPAEKGMVVTFRSYGDAAGTTIGGIEATDKSATYKGSAATIDIEAKGISYISNVTVVYPAAAPQDITGTWDLGNTDMQTAVMAFSGTSEAGEVEAIEKNGLKMTIEANGATFRVNGNNMQIRQGAVFKVPVRAAGDLITVKGYPGYSHYSIAGSAELTDENTYKAKISDAEAGYVAVTSLDGNNYYYAISVVQYAPKQKITLDNEAATVTFDFSEGTTGQKAEFSNADYFLSSKVTVGSNWTIQDKYTYQGVDETRLTPADQHNDNLTDDDAVNFLFTPKPGFTFTPTKVSFKANRYGTDNGRIDAYWLNADGTTVELEKEIWPERNNSNSVTEKSYDVAGATAGEGSCGLKLFLYRLQATKQIGLGDIVIEGILNGTEKDVPVLASFKVNGNQYAVEDVFGEQYEATLKLPKAEAMVSKSNPLTDVTATTGEVGEITYDEQDKACTVTIPMTAGDTQMSYVLNVIFKPDYKVEYIGVDGNVLATQAVEEDAAIGQFAFDINEAPATKEGYKARGWFKTSVLGEKYTTADVITADTKLYAIQTEIEESSTHKKYFFDLADKNFYAEDHEAFNPAGEGYYWHDGQHGWAFKNGNTVDLLVGPKATITVTLCQYGSGTGIVVKKGGETLATIDGKAEGDGGTAVYNYEGEAGTLTLEMQCGGEMYIHGMKIVNTAEVNFESDGDWYFVKAGDAGSLLDVLDVVNGKNAAKDAARSFIFLPNGTYDLDATVKTTISGHNISIIGESMDGTVIVTTPDKSIEGLGKADMFQVSGSNLYMQDLTLKNALDYYAAGSAGRATVIQDAGNRTIGKNVRMLSYQDTYYSSNSGQQAYWENCDIHGTVDFICGGGDIRFQNTTISLEPRALNGTGGRTIVAPTTNTKFGYVFDGCQVVDLAEGKGNWNFGRTWQNNPITIYLNTTLDDNAAKTLISSRWTEKGMNNKDPKLFGEFNTMDATGKNVTPESNKINSHGGVFETIINAEQAAEFSYAKMFSENAEKTWDPAALAKQAATPTNLTLNGKTLTWEGNGAQNWAVFKDGQLVGFTTVATYAANDANASYAVRAVNEMGGLSEAAEIISYATVKMSDKGYATFFDSQRSYQLPEGVKAYTVSEATQDALTYVEVADVIPVGTAVMLEAENKAGGEYTLASYSGPVEKIAYVNLLKGSDVTTVTTAGEDSWFYKLTYGKRNSVQANMFGWFWGAADGAAFQIEAHRAWLAIPKGGQSAPTFGYGLDGGATGINDVQRSTSNAQQYYNLNGQRVAQPAKGLYIVNGRKVVIK